MADLCDHERERQLIIRARICERLRSPGNDSDGPIPPAYVPWRAGTTNSVVVQARHAGNRFLDSLKGLQKRAQTSPCRACLCVLCVCCWYSLYTSESTYFICRLPSRQRFCIPPSPSPTHAAIQYTRGWQGGGHPLALSLLWDLVVESCRFCRLFTSRPYSTPPPPPAVPVNSCIPRQNLITFVFCPCAKRHSRYFWQIGAQMYIVLYIYLFRSLQSSKARRV